MPRFCPMAASPWMYTRSSTRSCGICVVGGLGAGPEGDDVAAPPAVAGNSDVLDPPVVRAVSGRQRRRGVRRLDLRHLCRVRRRNPHARPGSAADSVRMVM